MAWQPCIVAPKYADMPHLASRVHPHLPPLDLPLPLVLLILLLLLLRGNETYSVAESIPSRQTRQRLLKLNFRLGAFTT